jgi:hypothetical protein
MKRIAALLVSLWVLGRAPCARAQSREAISEQMLDYYEGEKRTAIVFTGLGASSAGVGSVLVRRGTSGARGEGSGDWSRGLGWSMIALGSLEALGAVFYAFQVGREIEHYSMVLGADPSMFKNEELTHIHGTTSRFVYYRTSEVGLAILGAGLATYGFAANKDGWKGAGIGIAVEALTFFVLDSFGTARAEAYEETVKKFDPRVSLGVGGGERPWSLDLSARF